MMDDIVQTTAAEFARLLLRFDRGRGSFEKFAFISLRNALHRVRRAEARELVRQAREVPYDTVTEVPDEA